MITLEQAKEAWKNKSPVLFHHPMMIRPIVCTVGGIEYSKRLNRLTKVILIQPPTGNSYIKTYPEHVSLQAAVGEEKPVLGKIRKEVNDALEELGRLKKEGYISE